MAENEGMPPWISSALGIAAGSILSAIVLDWYRERREAAAAQRAAEAEAAGEQLDELDELENDFDTWEESEF